MPFQPTVYSKSGLGVPGDLYADGPHRAQSYIIDSADPSYNVFGRAFTKVSEGKAQAGNPSASAVFAGILSNPKAHASYGTSAGGPLAPTLTLADNTQADLLTMGSLMVTLPAAAAIGDLVVFDNTTGALATISPGADLPVGKSFAHAVVDYYTVSGAGLAVITLTDVPVTPVLA